MPRRKNLNPEETAPETQAPVSEVTPPAAETPQPKPRSRRGSKKAESENAAAEPEAGIAKLIEGVKSVVRRGRRFKPPEETPTVPALPFVQPEAEPMVELGLGAEAAEESGQKRSRRRRTAKKSDEREVETATAHDDFADVGNDFPTITFRPRQGTPPREERERRPAPERSRRQGKKEEPKAQPQAQAQPQSKTRERRRVQPSAEPAPVQAFEPEPLPVVPVRPLIDIPEDAPQVVTREGVPTLVRDKRVYPPIAFFGNSTEGEARSKTVLEEIRLAGEAGVHLHSHLVEFEVDPRSVERSVTFAAYMLKRTLEADPEAQVLFRIVFIAPAGWTETYPDSKYETAEGGIGDPSVADDKFWAVAKECLKQFVHTLRLVEGRDHILGVHLERGEWFYSQGWGYDNSPAARNKFRDWARVRYRNDVVALRAAWFDGGVSFNTLLVPAYQPDAGTNDKFVRSSRRERRWVDYHLFLSDATVERIADLAYTAKQASEGYFLVGASYGYTFEWSHPASGHLSLGKLLRTPEIDFIAGPPSYRSRQPGGAAPFPGPIDSFSLNGKLYISEEDFKTSIGQQRQEPDDFNPMIKTPQALESVHWRGAGSALAHSSGVCWMDLWGNGWLKTPGIWQRAKDLMRCLINRMAAPVQDPDVAIFIDERALAYLVDEEAFALLVQNVRESVLRSGLTAAFYLLSDLQHREKFPESKLYVFLNAWDVRPELRAAIKTRLQRDNKVLFWVFAAGLFDSGRETLERAREVTGIALKPQPFHSKSGTTILNRRHPLCEAFPERTIGGVSARMEPSYFAIPEEATVLGEYTQTGLPSFVVREFNNDRDVSERWKSVFLGEPIVTPALLKALAHMAGVHVWNYQEDVTHVRPPFLTVHCTGAGPRTLTLPNKWVAYNLATEQWMASDSSSIRFQASDGSTHVFLVGVKEDLDNILTASPDDLLRMETLPPKPENTIRFDTASFDVSIMKLDEFMEGGDSDDSSDEFLFRPKFLEEAEEEVVAERSGRRRRRRGRRDREGSEETAGDRVAVEVPSSEGEGSDIGMNVVFRRRK
jgi:hypothetical protein